MKITEIRFDLKKGLPAFSSVAAGMTAQVEEGEDLDTAFDRLRQAVESQCSVDPSWVRRGDTT